MHDIEFIEHCLTKAGAFGKFQLMTTLVLIVSGVMDMGIFVMHYEALTRLPVIDQNRRQEND